mmetsp:Transcript_41150/g.129248  ORF Transcript_41150/g.129248 Transcript_41150/m.129248 type:complete len:247 (-) Transcript_41150:917-1657(-)
MGTLVHIEQGAAIPVEAMKNPNIQEERSDRADGGEDKTVDQLDGHPGVSREVTLIGGPLVLLLVGQIWLVPHPVHFGICPALEEISLEVGEDGCTHPPCSEDSDSLHSQGVHDRCLRCWSEAREDGEVQEGQVDERERVGDQIDEETLRPETVDVSAPLRVVLPVREDGTPVVAHHSRSNEDDRSRRNPPQHPSDRDPIDELRVEIDDPCPEVEGQEPCSQHEHKAGSHQCRGCKLLRLVPPLRVI